MQISANHCKSRGLKNSEKTTLICSAMPCATWSASWWDGKRIFLESWMLFCCNWFVRFRKLLALCCFTCAKMRAKNRIKINQNSDCCFAMRLPLCVFSAASRFVCHVAIRLRFGCCFAIRLLLCDSFAVLRFVYCHAIRLRFFCCIAIRLLHCSNKLREKYVKIRAHM